MCFARANHFLFVLFSVLLPFLDLCCRQEVLLLDNEIVFNEAIIEEREQGIQEIQQQIGEVNEIFKDLAVLVHEQGAMIGMSLLVFPIASVPQISLYCFPWSSHLGLADDIDSNIDSSHAATVQAKTQLAKASKTQRSNSSLVKFKYIWIYFLFIICSSLIRNKAV